MTSEDIAAMHLLASQIEKVLGVQVKYREPVAFTSPAGRFLIGHPDDGGTLTPDGAGDLADKLKELGISASWGTTEHFAEYVTIFGNAFTNQEKREKNLSTIMDHQDDLRKALKGFNLRRQMRRDKVQDILKKGKGFEIDPKAEDGPIQPLR